MTLLQRIGELRLKAVAADDEDRIKSRSGEFTALRERLLSVTANAENVAVGRLELQTAGLIEDGYDQNRAAALAVVKDLINTSESLSIDAKFDLVKMQGNSVEVHFKNSEKFVANVWKTHVPTPVSNDDNLLDALERGGLDVEAIRSDIQVAESALLVLRNRLLPRAGDLARMQQALNTLDSIGERIGQLIDPTIAKVVVRAQDGGVPYAEMTPEVTESLAKLGILGRFKVVLS